MKVAIISDSHDNLSNLKKGIDLIKKEGVEIIIHCGDVCSLSTLKEIFTNFSGEFHLVLGNVDRDHFKIEEVRENEFLNFRVWEEFGELEIEGKKIAFSHSPQLAERLALTQKYDFVFYGHTHRPWLKKIGKTKLINPGELAGIFFKPTFAILDPKTEKIELKILV